MKRNMGTVDRVLRTIVGLGIIAAGAYFHSWLGVIGIVPLATAALGSCPAYLPFGISTSKDAR